ncbi:MAG TPA: thiol:disulfide interchange protein DsbA/DsbL [Luteimonas sp.]|nr:thiol:disulfide interchange protein DsbA/DsbL [Luteimonas sp.]
MIKRLAIASLLAVLFLPALAFGQALVPGVDYVEVSEPKPFEPLAGKVEVVEVFGYWCHYCAEFQPLVSAWKNKLPADVRFTYVPAVYNDGDPFARGFYAAQGVKGLFTRTHDALFKAVNTDTSLPRNASVDELAAFYAQYGVDAAQFAKSMRDPSLDAKLARARDFAVAVELPGTPTLIVNGKYRILGNSYKDMLRIADQLIAAERKARR